MHNGTAIWDGHSGQAASAQWAVDYSASPTVTKSVTLQLEPGDSAARVAQKLAQKWHDDVNDPSYCAAQQGAVVHFTSNQSNMEIVGMRVTAKGVTTRIPANGTEVEVVPGLFVFRSD